VAPALAAAEDVMTGSGEAPRVSVVMPFLNPPVPFFREAIESVLGQTFSDLELLLVDDGSDDATAAIAREYGDRDPGRVCYLAGDDRVNRGPRWARRLGVREARGDLVALLDADDRWLPFKLKEQVALLEAEPEAGMLYGRTLYWSSWAEDPADADFTPQLGEGGGRLNAPPRLVVGYLTGESAVPCPSSVLARRRVILETGAFDGDFHGLYEDQAFFCIMALHSPVLTVDRTWEWYRLHPASITANTAVRAERDNRREFLDWLGRYLEAAGLHLPAVKETIDREIWKLEHPLAARLLRITRKAARRLGAALPRD
jgi:glycosyltransferase involved in cell wall biosynthesis